MSDMTAVLEGVTRRLASGTQLSVDDLHALWASPDLVRIGMLADEVRRRRHGDRTTFVRVHDVAAGGETGSVPPGAGEVRIVGAPATIDAAAESVRQAVAVSGARPVTAYTLTHLIAMTDGIAGLTDALKRLADEGLAAVAEAPVDAMPDVRRAVEVTLAAGLPIARFTIERPIVADPVARLGAVRSLQKATGALRSFAPLARAVDPATPTTGYDDSKLVALARLALDNVPSIQVDWRLYGPKLAQVALLFGADDVDAVSPLDETGEGRRRAPLEEIRRNISAASLVAVERDGRFAVRES